MPARTCGGTLRRKPYDKPSIGEDGQEYVKKIAGSDAYPGCGERVVTRMIVKDEPKDGERGVIARTGLLVYCPRCDGPGSDTLPA